MRKKLIDNVLAHLPPKRIYDIFQLKNKYIKTKASFESFLYLDETNLIEDNIKINPNKIKLK